MARYLILLPAPEAEWANLPIEEHEKGMRAHARFNRELEEGGHTVVTASPLTASARAVSMRPDGKGGTTVTDGPFTESVEQIVGFYLIESNDRDGLLKICAQLASTGDLIEFRELAQEPEDLVFPHPDLEEH
ncbi:YciI family protein [Yimella radicis]